jgi:hypothetical protein
VPPTRSEIGQRGRIKGRELLMHFCTQAIEEIDIVAMAAEYDLDVRDGGLTGAEGRLTRGPKGGIIRIRADISEPRRRRFIVAHELGHFFLHPNTSALCVEKDLVKYDAGDGEAEANAFAAEVLMPRPLFEPFCNPARPSLHVVKKLADAFTTTLTATAIRFVDLTEEACAVVWSEAGRVKWSIPGRNFYPWVAFGRTLNTLSHAGDAFGGEPLPDTPREVPARAWVDGGGDLWEHSVYFQSLSAVFTLLWRPARGD